MGILIKELKNHLISVSQNAIITEKVLKTVHRADSCQVIHTPVHRHTVFCNSYTQILSCHWVIIKLQRTTNDPDIDILKNPMGSLTAYLGRFTWRVNYCSGWRLVWLHDCRRVFFFDKWLCESACKATPWLCVHLGLTTRQRTCQGSLNFGVIKTLPRKWLSAPSTGMAMVCSLQ